MINSLNPSGQAVKESLAAEYSTRHPRCSSNVQSHLEKKILYQCCREKKQSLRLQLTYK